MDSYEPPPAQSSLRRQGISRPTSAHPRSRPTSAHPRTRSVTFAPKTNATNQQKSQTRALLSSSNAQHTSSTSSLRTRKKGRKKVRPSSSTLSRSHSQSYINNRHRPKSAVPLSKMLQSQSSVSDVFNE